MLNHDDKMFDVIVSANEINSHIIMNIQSKQNSDKKE